MRRAEKEIDDPKELELFLKNNIVCHISINDTPYPYIIPLNYGYDSGSLYFHCAREGKKIDLLRQNPHAAFEVSELLEIKGEGEKACTYTSLYKSIIGFGKIEFIEGDEDKIKAFNILMNQIAGKSEWHYSHRNIQNVTVLRLDIISMTGKQSLGS